MFNTMKIVNKKIKKKSSGLGEVRGSNRLMGMCRKEVCTLSMIYL